jgi:hypothetical protein
VRWWLILLVGLAVTGLLVAVVFFWPSDERLRGVAESDAGASLSPVAPPTFSVLRLDPDGALAASGGAAPGATVTLSIDGKLRVQLRADAHGEWVLKLAEAFRPGDHEVGLNMRLADARELAADAVAVVAAPKDLAEAPLIALVRPGGPSTLLQAPGGSGGPRLRVEAADYRKDGSVLLSGGAAPGATVHVFRGEAGLGTVQAGTDGHWALAESSGALAEDAGAAKELRLVTFDETGAESARVGVALPLAPGTKPLREAAYARIEPEAKQWRIAWRDDEGQVHWTSVYAADASRVIDPLPTPEPRP